MICKQTVRPLGLERVRGWAVTEDRMEKKSNLEKCPYSIIIPVYNEVGNIMPLYENILLGMEQISESFEVIFIDDGSNDGTKKELKKLVRLDKRFRYIFFNGCYGQSAALDCGFKEAKGEVIITMDGDLQVDARDLCKLLDKLDGSDLVIGIRKNRDDGIKKRISSKWANKIRNLFLGENFLDSACPLKVFKRKILNQLILFDGMHRFFPTLVKLQGYSVTQVEITHQQRFSGKSKYNFRNRIFKTTIDLLAVCWIKKRYLKYNLDQKHKEND
jgi:glycosyltransferase involved in cell wall biosynthesis